MRKQKIFIAFLRVALGWVFLYQGIVAFTNPQWTILPYIENAQSFSSVYSSLAAASVLVYVEMFVAGAFVLSGVLLIVGLGVRLASFLGILLMLFFYFPRFLFPRVGMNYYIIDEHIIFAFILAHLFVTPSHTYLGLGSLFRKSRTSSSDYE